MREGGEPGERGGEPGERGPGVSQVREGGEPSVTTRIAVKDGRVRSNIQLLLLVTVYCASCSHWGFHLL